MNYENEFLEYLEGLVGDLDKRIRRGRERLQRSADHKEKVCLTGLKLLPTKYCVCVCVCARMHSVCVCSVCMHVTMSMYMCAVCVLCVCVQCRQLYRKQSLLAQNMHFLVDFHCHNVATDLCSFSILFYNSL